VNERLKALRPLLLRLVGYPVFFLTFFVLFLYVTFPYERLKDYIIAQVEAPRVTAFGATIPSNIELTIGKLSPTFFPGLRARDVVVTYLPTATGGRPVFMHIDDAVVHISLLSLLARRANIDFDIEGMGGEIEGNVSYNLGTATTTGTTSTAATAAADAPGVRAFAATFKDVNVTEFGPLVQAVGLPLEGTLNGMAELSVPDGAVAQAEGKVELTIARFSVGDGRAQFQIPHFGGVTIERIRAGDFAFNVAIRRGVATLERVGSQSDEFALSMDGRVNLRANLADSAMNIGMRFKLTDVYRAKSEQAARILTVMDMAPDLQRARGTDGMMGFRCTGTFSRPPVCLPDQRAGGPPGGTAAVPAPM
jgi:type II secretion system protein N